MRLLLSSALLTLSLLVLPTLSAAVAPAVAAVPVAPASLWVPDDGKGNYKNPVLFADYSDPDAIRVGNDYYLVSSSFSHVPGLPILHSRDLVNWTLINHALPTLDYAGVPPGHFAVPRHGEGVWAPAIRFHDGKFLIYFPDPDFGLYVTSATDPAGVWSKPVLIKAGKGLIDPCPFWDDDGQAYLVHGWAKSRSGISNQLTLLKLDRTGTKTLDAGTVIIDANKLTGWRTLEGPKLYKRKGWYYLFAPAGGVTEGYQAVFRSKSLYGPWENRTVLEQGKTDVNGPHQGAWVDTPTGENWFLHFQDRGPYGRVVHLQPMAWRADDWPVMGSAVGTNQLKGEPLLAHAKPAGPSAPSAVPATSDEFNGLKLGQQWQWQANPRGQFFSLQATPGSLRLACVPTPGAGLYNAPQLLLQKFPGPEFTVTTKLTFGAAGEATGEEAGLVIFGYSYAWVGVRHQADGLKLVHVVHADANAKGTENEVESVAMTSSTVYLRVSVKTGAQCTFAYSLDGKKFTTVGEAFPATVGRWVGAKVGLFAARPDTADTAGKPSVGYADFDWFRVSPLIP
jgi:beta-xylosidase